MIYCYAIQGFEGELVSLEVELRRSLPGMDLVGLPDGAVREAKERVRAAIRAGGYEFPRDRILVNLSPAGIQKTGTAYDLAIAASILSKTGQTPLIQEKALIMGELQLSGVVRAVPGILSAITRAYEQGIRNFFIPHENLAEVEQLKIGHCIGIQHIGDFKQRDYSSDSRQSSSSNSTVVDYPDFSEIYGQEILKRALTIAVAGRHHTLIFGPPGCGKTYSSRAVQGIMPKLEHQDAIDVTRLWSQAGKWDRGIIDHPPFREPHHSASAEGILGGTSQIAPGEISLAHQGILFLDEVPEFSRKVLQGLREPLETGSIRIVRAGKSYWFPADFQLLMTANPCPCGNLGRKAAPCVCSTREIDAYWRGLSGPLLDRVDIRVPLEPVDPQMMFGEKEETSSSLLERVNKARLIQKKRNQNLIHPWNSTLNSDSIKKYCSMDESAKSILLKGVEHLGLSSRAMQSVIRVARTIADLDSNRDINKDAVLEALSYRRYGEADIYWKQRK